MTLFAGIDGGQSGTHAVIGDERGRILARGAAGPADEVGQDASSTRLHDALSGALADAARQANLAPDARYAQVVAGISGYEGRVYGEAPELPADALQLVHDTVIAHAGAFAGAPGVIVIAGTGSVAYGVNAHGANATCGGWGYLFGDEGSAFWLARRTIAQAMRDADAAQPADCTAEILQTFGVSSLRRLARAFYAGEISRAQVAAFAANVLRRAECGDEESAAQIGEAARALVTLAMQTMDALAMQGAPVAYTGGMLQSATFAEEIAQCMRSMLPRAQHVPPRYDAACGALLLAYKAGGAAVTELQT